MIDPNILACIIGIVFAVLTHKILIRKYIKGYNFVKSYVESQTKYKIKTLSKRKSKELSLIYD